MASSVIVSIASRFCGPSTSGNGGYTAGLMADVVTTLESATGAAHAPTEALSTRLRRPPPLGVPLRVQAGGDGQYLLTGLDRADASPIAESRWRQFAAGPVPTAVDPATARATRPRNEHWSPKRFGDCFVCGCARAVGDGLRLAPGAVDPRAATVPGLVATTWTPDASLYESGFLAPRFIWSALDCPGYFAVADDEEYLLLAEMSARIHATVPAGTTLLVQAWPLGAEKRSKFAGTALYTEAGILVAAGHTRWVAPRR
jgi:hypothetical protein